LQIVKEFLTKAGICVHLEKKVNVSATENNFVTLVDDLLAKSENVKVFIAFLDPEVRHYIINQHSCAKPACQQSHIISM